LFPPTAHDWQADPNWSLMNIRPWRSALVVACTLLLAGCASSRADTADPSASAAPRAAAMTPGMVMPDGSTMGAGSSSVPASRPSAPAKMICSDDVRGDLADVLKLKSKPTATSRWVAPVFTCTYRLPMGALVLSVTESADDAGAHAFAAGLRKRLPATASVAGLTDVAYQTKTGIVALVKDNDTLVVDASRLPAQFGTEQQKRGDFAYEVASVILGCWTGDDES
jgi:hypothetical protein